MKRSILSVTFGSTLLCLFVTFAPAAQAAPRTFVSAQQGSDANPCTLNQPCRQFTKAITEVDGGGQVIALDSGGYAPFSINKSVSILAAPGALVSIIAGGGFQPTVAITITPIIAGVEVVLRGLTLKAGPGGLTGIEFGAAALHVENCRIDGFLSHGLSMASSGQLTVRNTVFTNVSSRASAAGIQILGTPSGKARVAIDGCSFESNGYGLAIGTQSEVTVSNSLFSGNQRAIRSHTFTANPVGSIVVNVENCVLTNGDVGVQSDASFGGSSLVRISNSTITNHTFAGVLAVSGQAFSRGNNTIEGNATDIFGGLVLFTAK